MLTAHLKTHKTITFGQKIFCPYFYGDLHMSRFCPLFSGSGGNSTYISSAGCGILIDAGVSCKALLEALENAGGDVKKLCAVAVTHEHSDHIKGLKTFLKKTGLPVAASAETLAALESAGIIPVQNKTIPIGSEPIDFGGLCLSRFATSHDCNGSSGYVVTLSDGTRAGVCTDLGIVNDGVRDAIRGCGTLLIESNHDVEMLKRGPYPPQLKLRILSEKGHLSNSACSAELAGLLKSGCTRFILGHISLHNNLPMLALSSAKAALLDAGAAADRDYIITAAKPAGNGVVVF